jgi:hypothetical protein
MLWLIGILAMPFAILWTVIQLVIALKFRKNRSLRQLTPR